MTVRLFKRHGIYYLDFRDPITQKRKRRSTGTKVRKIAEVERDMLIHDYAKSPVLNGDGIMFDQFVPVYLERHAELHLAESTVRAYTSHLKMLKPYMSAKPLHTFTGADISDVIFEIKKARRFSKSTATKYINVLSSFFSFAKESGYVVDNPCAKVKRFKSESDSKPYQYFKRKESEALLDAAEGDFYMILKTALLTGMRTGELIGLQWDDIDFDKNIITVARSYDKPTKSGKPRHVPMHEEVCVGLLIHKTRYVAGVKFERVLALMDNSPYVFPSPVTGGMRNNFKTAWLATVRRAGIRYRRFHCTRHTFATNFLLSGGSMADLKIIGGWKSSKMIDKYSHLAEESQHLQDAINKMRL